MTTKAILTSIAVVLAAATPSQAAIVINEINSQGAPDWVELTNTGVTAVDISGYVIRDSNDNNTFSVPAGTTLAPGGFYSTDLPFGLGNPDAVRLFTAPALASQIDAYEFPEHAATSYGRCAGAMLTSRTVTRGTANDCPVLGTAWPGGATVSLVDTPGAFTDDVSGLAYQPSGTGAPGVLYAVRNGPSTLYRLLWNGAQWTPDAANGWANGKTLRYPNGTGAPDAEGVTLVPGEPDAVYVSVERDGAGASSPGILRYEVTGASTTIDATREWNLLADLPGLGANGGLEAIAWVPDSLLVAKGLVDDSRGGAKYDPDTYPQHGSGLFFVGVEQTGDVIGYALTPAGATRVTTVASGFPSVMDLVYEPETTHLWAVCDNTCDGRIVALDIGMNGRFAPGTVFERPAGMLNYNNEGFTIAPQQECVSGRKPVFWSDDSAVGGRVLRAGTFNCTVPQPGTGDPDPTATPTPTPVASVQPTPTPTPTVDRTAPKLRLSLTKPATKGTYAVRRTGKLRLTVTLDERADLTLTATARKSAKAKARTLTRTTRKGVAAGRSTYTLTLSRKVRKALKKGETITLTVQARDAAGNTGTARTTGKVR